MIMRTGTLMLYKDQNMINRISGSKAHNNMHRYVIQ